MRDPKGQKGVQWRMQKLEVIRKLVKAGKSRAWVIWFLRTKTGLTLPTAKALVNDAFLEEPKGDADEIPATFGIYDMGFPDLQNKRLTKASQPNLSARGARSNTPDIHNSNHQKRRK